MEPAVLSALSAILGSAVDGSATMPTSWLTQRTNEGSKRMLEEFDHQRKGYDQVFPLYSIMNRIRLRCSEEVLKAADRGCTRIVEQFFKPNLSDEQMRELVLAPTDDATMRTGSRWRWNAARITSRFRSTWERSSLRGEIRARSGPALSAATESRPDGPEGRHEETGADEPRVRGGPEYSAGRARRERPNGRGCREAEDVPAHGAD